MKITRWLLGIGLLLCLSPVLFIWAALLNIKYRPLPPIPRHSIRYYIRDSGASKDDWRAFYSWNDSRFEWQLSDVGKVIFDDPRAAQRNKRWKSDRAARAKKLGLRDDYLVRAIRGSKTLVSRGNSAELWDSKTVQASCKNRVADYAKWPIYNFELQFFGAGNEIIGSGRIATAGASSGGTSEPHGRQFPILWDGKSSFVRDLNSEIDPKTGWILFRALAVNARGQILCLGQKTDAKGAEKPDWKQLRRLILTPRSSNPPN
ncbi:MAG TPA: hypothetical protein VGB45_11925 [Abditibacterium sp.]|jgi:hypothetical protein